MCVFTVFVPRGDTVECHSFTLNTATRATNIHIERPGHMIEFNVIYNGSTVHLRYTASSRQVHIISQCMRMFVLVPRSITFYFTSMYTLSPCSRPKSNENIVISLDLAWRSRQHLEGADRNSRKRSSGSHGKWHSTGFTFSNGMCGMSIDDCECLWAAVCKWVSRGSVCVRVFARKCLAKSICSRS